MALESYIFLPPSEGAWTAFIVLQGWASVDNPGQVVILEPGVNIVSTAGFTGPGKNPTSVKFVRLQNVAASENIRSRSRRVRDLPNNTAEEGFATRKVQRWGTDENDDDVLVHEGDVLTNTEGNMTIQQNPDDPGDDPENPVEGYDPMLTEQRWL